MKFGKEENIRNIVFEEEHVIDSAQVLIPNTVLEINLVIENNVLIIVDDIVQEQYNNEVLPQIPIQTTLTTSRSVIKEICREKRSSISDDYIIFLQEHKDDIGLTEDDPINFCQAIHSSNS